MVTEIINSYYNQVKHQDWYFNFNLFTIVEYCLLTYFIYRLIRSKVLRTIILVMSVVYLVISIYDIIGPDFNSYDALSSSLETLFLILFSVFYLFEQISKPDHIFFYAIPEFWVIVAILIYFSGTFFLVNYAQSLLKNESTKVQYSLINTTFDLLKSLLLSVAMVVKGGDKKNNQFSRIDFGNLDEHLNLNR